MIVLDQHGIVKPLPVGLAPAVGDRQFLEHSHSRTGLAGGGDRRPGPVDSFDVGSCQSCDAGQAGEKIEHGPFRRQDRYQPALEPADLGAGGHPLAVLHQRQPVEIGIDLQADLGGCRHPRDNTGFAGDNARGADIVSGEDRTRGDIAGGVEVFFQRQRHDAPQAGIGGNHFAARSSLFNLKLM